MHRFADNSGGVYREAGAESLRDIYADIRHAIRRVWIANFKCDDCDADGRVYPFRVSLASAGGRQLSSDLEIRMPFRPPKPPPLWWKQWWVYAAIGVLAAAVTLIVIFVRRRKKPEEPQMITFSLPENEYVPAPREPAGLRLKLAVVKGTHPGKTHELRLAKRAVIGRKQECDVVLKDDDEVSGRHCELALVDGKVIVYDLQSRNGTCVNGVPIVSRYRIESGDSILVGRTEFRVTIQDAL